MKSFGVQQSFVDTRVGNFLDKRFHVFLLLSVEISASFLLFLVEQRGTLLRLLSLTATNLFGFERLISWQYPADRPVMAFSCLYALINNKSGGAWIAGLERQILSLYQASAPCFGSAKLSSLLTTSWPYLNFSKSPLLGLQS